MGVTVEALVAYKCMEIKDWKHGDITEMLGVYNAIRDGEITVEETFKPKEQKKDEPDLKTKSDGKLL
jgi:hypothetical protein